MSDAELPIVAGQTISRRSLVKGAAAGAGVLALGMPRAAFAQQKLLWYTSASVDSAEGWVKLFQKLGGVPVEYYRAGGVKLAQKFEQEAKSGNVLCDVVDLSLPGLMTQWAEQGLLMKYDSPEAVNYPKDLQMPGYWVPVKALDTCMAYNADIVKPADAPKHWADLIDPKWKGKMVMSDPFVSGAALHWYYAVRKLLGKEFMEKLAKQNILLRSGGGEVADTLVSGERPVAAFTQSYYISEKAAEGVNVDMVFPPEGVPAGMVVIGISAKARNPEAAKKFVDFALGKPAQEEWQNAFYTATLRKGITPLPEEHGRVPFEKVKLIFSTAADTMEVHKNQGALLDEFGALFK